MITKQDFLDNGFKIESETRDEHGTIPIGEWELPGELVRQWKEDFRSQVRRESYTIDGKKYSANINCYIFSGSNPLAPDADLKPGRVYLKAPTTTIAFKRGKVELFGEWVDGDERLQTIHTYVYEWERLATRLNFKGMLREYLAYCKRMRKNCINTYKRELRDLRKSHMKHMEENREMIEELQRNEKKGGMTE